MELSGDFGDACLPRSLVLHRIGSVLPRYIIYGPIFSFLPPPARPFSLSIPLFHAEREPTFLPGQKLFTLPDLQLQATIPAANLTVPSLSSILPCPFPTDICSNRPKASSASSSLPPSCSVFRAHHLPRGPTWPLVAGAYLDLSDDFIGR